PGKMAWYYQTGPHDTHDWDSAQTPALVDAEFGGTPRKLVLTAARNGYFFVVDRVTGEHLVTSKLSNTANWAKGINEKGQPVRDPVKDDHIGGSLVSSAGGLLFGGDAGGNLVAYDAATGKILWHARLGQISNAPQTYLLDGRQYVLQAAGDTLYAFVLNQ